MYFSHVKGQMSLLYVGCMKFFTNQFVENLCPSNNSHCKSLNDSNNHWKSSKPTDAREPTSLAPNPLPPLALADLALDCCSSPSQSLPLPQAPLQSPPSHRRRTYMGSSWFKSLPFVWMDKEKFSLYGKRRVSRQTLCTQKKKKSTKKGN